MGEITDALQRARRDERPKGSAGNVAEDRQVARESRRTESDFPREPWLSPEPPAKPVDSGSEPPPDAGQVVFRGGPEGRSKPHTIVADAEGPLAESVRQLAVRVRAELERRSARSVAIVSALRGEGKSTLSCNLALALATLTRGREVALVELDLRAPTLAAAFGVEQYVGIETFLEGTSSLGEICTAIEKPPLDLYLCGEAHPAAHEYLVRPQAARLLRELERRYAVVVVDTPPVLLVPDAALILRHVDAYAAVARAGSTRVRSFRRLLDHLAPEKLIGGILNEGSRPLDAGHYGYYEPLPDPDGPDAER